MRSDPGALLALMNELLRSPARVAGRCRDDADLRPLVLVSFLAIFVGGALFGAVLGAPRGALQAAFAGIKLPLAMLAALVVCAPAFHVLNAGLSTPLPFRSIVALTLAATARAALVLLACAPALWLAMDTVLGYHQAVLAAAGAYFLAGVAALGVVHAGLQRGVMGLLTAVAFVGVLLPVGGQTAWMLRPFLGRPSQVEVPLFRGRESSFADAVATTAWSAVGVFREVEARGRAVEGAFTDADVAAVVEEPRSVEPGRRAADVAGASADALQTSAQTPRSVTSSPLPPSPPPPLGAGTGFELDVPTRETTDAPR